MHPHIQQLIRCIELEEKEQLQRFRLDEQHSLRQLKAEGLALHPISITRKTFGYADYPEISFKLNFPAETYLFRDGAAIECFCSGMEPVKGVLIQMEEKSGSFRLFAPDFPDWIEDGGVGIKLAPDTRTTAIMKKVLQQLEKNPDLMQLFEQIHDHPTINASASIQGSHRPIDFIKSKLNESQQNAVMGMLSNERITILHGPPGTGKTTTLIEGILQLIRKGEKILLSAPSNTAVDHIAKGLLQQGVRLLRVGNLSKVDDVLFAHTPEGKLNNSAAQKEIKQLKIRAEEFRRMALKYKRNFGKAEREQRRLLFQEVKQIRTEIKKLQTYHEDKLYEEATVIAGTPIGLYDAGLSQLHFDTLILDEAGQCIEPLAWCLFPLADKYVLAGDHLQLPPTVLSQEAVQSGFNHSILEVAIRTTSQTFLLNTQYRMREVIAGFSSNYFYNSLLKTAKELENTGTHLTFIDTAGSGFQEQTGSDGMSLKNEGELNIVLQLLQTEPIHLSETALITPYAGQVAAAKELLPKEIRLSTIDSFQGQEKETIIISLVRSNDEGQIGFLKDYRRMNVAFTRAKEQLYIIGDSATLGSDPFYNALLIYMEQHGMYKSVWEYEI